MRQIRELWITVNLNLELLPLEGKGHRLDSCLPRKHFHFLDISCGDNSGRLVALQSKRKQQQRALAIPLFPFWVLARNTTDYLVRRTNCQLESRLIA